MSTAAVSPRSRLGTIAPIDAGRSTAGVALEGAYLASTLSADAVPALLDALPTLEADQRSVIARQLLTGWTGSDPRDWRSWNRSAARARRLVRHRAPTLAAMVEPRCPPREASSRHCAPTQGGP